MKVSIIVPCYSVASKLTRCVRNLLAQTFTDWELILVDDGSTDNTWDICNSFTKNNAHIHAVHKENGGVSSARNAGIEIAKGEFITFIDADDYVKPDYLQKLVEGQEADLVLCGFRSSTGIDFTPEPQYLIGDDLSKNIQAIVENDYLLYSPWCKLFRRDIIQKHQHRFDPEIRLGEDTIFCYKYLLYCYSIKVVASNSYFYDGVWGGYKKYVLTRQEVEYLDKAEITTLHDINQHFNCRIDLTYRGYHVAMIKGLYEKFRDYDTFEMYTRTHDVLPPEHFFANHKLSYIFWGIVELETLYVDKEYCAGKLFMHRLHHFFTIPTNQLLSYSYKMRLIHYLVKSKHYTLAHVLLIFLSILKH